MIRRVAAIALLGIRAPLRSRLVLGLLALLAVILAGIRGDGTAQGEMRMLLTWTLGVAAGVLGAATLWAGCAAVASDIEAGRHAPTAVSPARPFEIWLGRWLYEQKVLLRKQSPKLSADKIDKLRKLLGEEPAEKVG